MAGLRTRHFAGFGVAEAVGVAIAGDGWETGLAELA
jgi:hypothetical protein